MERREQVEVDFNVEHGKGDDLFQGSARVRAIMEGGLAAYVAQMNRMMGMAISNDDERQKLQQIAERERIEAQEKYKGGD
jgi:hypothetical protein